MKQVLLSLNVEQYKELAKLATLGSWLIYGSDVADDSDLASEVICELCEAGYEAGGFGIFKRGIPSSLPIRDDDFVITNDFCDECEKIEDNYNTRMFNEELAARMGAKDFKKKYGDMNTDELLEKKELITKLFHMQEFYRQEFLLNGTENLKFIKKKKN